MNTPKPTPPPARLAPAPAPAPTPALADWRLTMHARKQCATKGIAASAVLAGVARPQTTYPSRRVVGQYRYVTGEVVAVVDPATRTVVTVYLNTVETPLRADQTDADAQAHAARTQGKGGAA